MLNISEIVDNWESQGAWKIAPAGVDWIAEGSRIIVGSGCSIGNHCSIGDYCSIGSGCSISSNCSIGDYCSISSGCSIGDYCSFDSGCRVGSGCSIGSDCSIGSGCIIGSGCSGNVYDIGYADGYRKIICSVNGIAYIGAGCRWFNLKTAIEHWSNKPDRVHTLVLMQSAIAIAKLHNLSFE